MPKRPGPGDAQRGCLLGDKPEVKAAERIYQCTSAGRDVASVMADCTEGLGLDPKTQQALSCARAGRQRQVAGCSGSREPARPAAERRQARRLRRDERRAPRASSSVLRDPS